MLLIPRSRARELREFKSLRMSFSATCQARRYVRACAALKGGATTASAAKMAAVHQFARLAPRQTPRQIVYRRLTTDLPAISYQPSANPPRRLRRRGAGPSAARPYDRVAWPTRPCPRYERAPNFAGQASRATAGKMAAPRAVTPEEPPAPSLVPRHSPRSSIGRLVWEREAI
jgi:hypothetical protein